MSAHLPRRQAAGAALAVLCLGVLTACGDDVAADGPGGTTVVVGHVSDEVTGRPGTIVVPTGRLEVTVGAPLQQVGPDLATDGETHDAPDGGALVPVSWSFDALAEIPGRAVVGTDPKVMDVTLEAGDDRIELPAPYVVKGVGIADSPVGVFYVAVTTSGDQVSLAATYDGLTQTLDVASGTVDSGAAQPLYADADGAQDLDCSPTAPLGSAGLSATATCAMSIERVPYYPGTGWAEAGRSFAVVGYDVRTADATGPQGKLDVTDATATLQVDGAGPLGSVDTIGETAADGEAQSIEVFDAPRSGGEARLEVTFSAVYADAPDGDREPRELQFTRSLTLP